MKGEDLWDNPNEYIGRSGHEYSVYPLNQASDLTPRFRAAGASCEVSGDQQECAFAPASAIYTVQLRHLANGTGAVLLAHVTRSYQRNNRIRGLIADQVTAFFRLPSSIPEPRGSISGKMVQPNGEGGSLFRVGDDRLNVLRRGRGWELLSFRSAEMFDALSLRGDMSPEVSRFDRSGV